MTKSSVVAGWIGILLLMLYAGWELFYQRDAFTFEAVSSIMEALAALYASILLAMACRRLFLQGYWKYYALGAFCFFLAQCYGTFEFILMGENPERISPAQVLRVVQYVFFLIGLYRQNRHVRNHAFPFVFDILLFTTVSLTLYWQQFIRPLSEEYDITEAVIVCNLMFSSVNLVILMFLIIFDRGWMTRGARIMLIAAFAFQTAASTLSWFLDTRPGWQSTGNFITDFCWFAGLLCMGYAGVLDEKGSGPSHRAAVRSNELKQYVPLVFGGLLLVLLLAGSYPATPVAFACLIGVVLMLVRLFFGIRQSESVNKALRETNQTYQTWTENALVGVFIEQDNQLVYANRHCEEVFGYERGQMIGRTILSHIAPSDLPKFLSEADKLQNNLPTSRFGVSGVKRDQTPLFLELHLSRTYYRGKLALTGTLIDITERKLSEQYLIRSEKLSVVGQLAAGVAHEIRNPLTALKGFTQLLHQNADENRKYFEIMLTELERINYIVGEFMVLSKPHNQQQLQDHDIHVILMSIIPILESQAILHNVIIRVDPVQDLPRVKCDANQIKQVLINLMKNAIEAMPDGGTVTVRFENDLLSGELVMYIEDQGEGMPPELLERLGEPFLTTKEKGTGLGLMVCFKIIQAHGGSLSFGSTPGQGTSVKLVLPASKFA